MSTAKIKKWFSMTVAFMIMLNHYAIGQTGSNSSRFKTTSISKGERLSNNHFAGNVWFYQIGSDPLALWSISKVSFAAGSYSDWHKHSGMQVLVITEGAGYLKVKGKPVHLLNKGDVVTIQPGVMHWHGATPQSVLVQIATNHDNKKSIVEWLGKVTDSEYNSVN